jgi:D-methionine transport system substrate-binding protein
MFKLIATLHRRYAGQLLQRSLAGVSLSIVLSLIALSGCKSHSGNTLKVGITPGPAEDILHAVEPVLAKQGLTLQIVRFSDYIQPNMALASHDLDVNLYQNVAFLTQFNHDHQTSFVAAGRVYLPLMAIYPGRTKTLSALANGSRIAIPNDPVNHDRALLLLEKAGLITLQHEAGSAAVHVVGNPKQLKLVELDAAQLPRSLEDVDAAVINANFALDAGLNPHTGSWLSETRDSPYANVLAVNADTQSDARVRALAAALASPEARSFITAHYGGAVYPAD